PVPRWFSKPRTGRRKESRNMLYNPDTTLRPLLRHRCRNPHCGAALREPTENRLDAFCCPGCFANFYRSRCLVCERPIAQKTKPRQICDRTKCRGEFRRHPERFRGTRYLASGLSQISAGSAHFTGLKNGQKRDRPFRVIAGRVPHPINLQVPLDPELRARLNRLHSRVRGAPRARREARRIAVEVEIFDPEDWEPATSSDGVEVLVTRRT